MKKLINDPRDVVREMLEGLVDLALLENENVVVRADLPPVSGRPVAVISGGGAGHEPAHALQASTSSRKERWAAAAEAAELGAKATASTLPRLGRASYLDERAVGAPDGGAVAVSIWVRAIADAIPSMDH